jgi:hypothetical protein
VTDLLDQFRREAVTVHQLPEGTDKFLVGQTPMEIETSAKALAKLLGERRQEPEPVGFLQQALAAKAERKAALYRLLCGRQAPARDMSGRFASSTRP